MHKYTLGKSAWLKQEQIATVDGAASPQNHVWVYGTNLNIIASFSK